jgi:PPM family protein phosphatase
MYNPGQGIRLRGSARTDTGKVRENNEDSIHLWAQKDHMILAVVADGMGGAVAGEEASRIVIEAIQTGIIDHSTPQVYETMAQDVLIEHLKEAIREGNENIIDQASAHPELKGMGTTITAAFIRNTHIVIGHVGDSRAYLVDGEDGHIEQITADHSFVQALVAAGHISEEEAEEHPMRNVLYRALGQARDVEIDVYYEQMRSEDRLVLCSDGLTLHVEPDEIARIVMDYPEPGEASEKMVALTNKRGGRDNVSVIVVKAEEVSETAFLDDTVTIELNSAGDYDDEDTIVAPNGFGSSESRTSPNAQQRDGESTHVEPPGMFSQTPQSRENEEDTQEPLQKEETLGEGRDLYTNNQ